ncbi:hypothetical protein [Mycobacterium sp. OAE908]|uniref:hypothetical protein n=1 Tax=Mycobacterium sp. OAE908 TaxID=2817899 RepID=UPI001AEA5563
MSSTNTAGGLLTISVSGPASHVSEFDVAQGSSVHVEIPSDYTEKHNALATKDLEILSGILSGRSDEVSRLISAASRGEFDEARSLAKQIGIVEDNFVSQDGGLWGLVVVIAVVAAVTLAHD